MSDLHAIIGYLFAAAGIIGIYDFVRWTARKILRKEKP